jgi:hypothetical protein
MFEFWKGMIAFRKSDFGNVFKSQTAVPEGYYRFIEPENTALFGYFVDDKVLVLMNVGDEKARIDNLQIPEGKWKLIGHNSGVNHTKGVSVKGKSKN